MEDRTSEQTRQNSWKNKMEAKMAEIVLKQKTSKWQETRMYEDG